MAQKVQWLTTAGIYLLVEQSPTIAAVPYPLANRTTPLATLLRRLVTVPTMSIAAVIVIMTLPVTLPIAAVLDVILRRWRFGTVRIVAFAAWYLFIGVLVQVHGAVMWVVVAFGRRSQTERAMTMHYATIRWWIACMMGGLRVTLGLRIEPDHPELLVGPSIVLARHQSLADVFVPTGLSIIGNGTWIRVVLAAGLVNEPSLDLFGHRTPQYFIQRNSSDPRSEVVALTRLARHTDENTVLIIFPEGGLFREDRKESVLASLERRDPAQAERGRHLRHLLPPRVAGFAGLLDGAPHADVVIVGHVGYDELTDPLTVWKSVPLRHPAKVSVRRFIRSEVPDGREARRDWLNDRWDEMDEWINSEKTARAEILADRQER